MTGERNVDVMHETDDDVPEPDLVPAPGEIDHPPVGEPLVVSRRNPDARPTARADARSSGGVGKVGQERGGSGSDSEVPNGWDGDVEPAAAPELDGVVALVTAATGDLGGAVAGELLGRGANVLLVDDDLSALASVAGVSDSGSWAVPLRCDVGSSSQVESVCEFVARSVTVDLVVHVAPAVGSSAGGPLDELDRRYRSEVRAPVELVAGLAGSLAADARVVVVDEVGGLDDPDGGGVLPHSGSVPHGVAVEHLWGMGVRRSSRVTRGPRMSVSHFAAALVDLVGVAGVPFDRVVMGIGPGDPADGSVREGTERSDG